MEEKVENRQPETEEESEGYVPRPAFQVWGARIAAVVFGILIILQILSIAGGGR